MRRLYRRYGGRREERKYGKKAPKWTLGFASKRKARAVRAKKEKRLDYGKEVCWLQ